MTEQAAKSKAEASGLADIQGIAAALKDAGASSSAGADTFGFGSSGATPLVFDEASAPINLSPPERVSPILANPAPPITSERPKGLMIAAGILAAAAAVLAAVALNQGDKTAEHLEADNHIAVAAVAPNPPATEPGTVAQGIVAGVAGTAPIPPPEPEPEPEPKLDSESSAPDADEPDPESGGSTNRRPGPGNKTPAAGPGKTSEPPVEPGQSGQSGPPDPPVEPETPPPPAPALEDGTKFGADCLLNPTAPGCGPAKKHAATAKQDDVDLPEQLSNADVRNGFTAVKGKAKGCGVTHGIFPGSKVLVKVSIEGATGKVLSAQAMGEHAGTRGGECVSTELGKAVFPPFKKSVMGVTYPVRI